MKILALDPASITGWATSAGKCGVWLLPNLPGLPLGDELVELRRRIVALREAYAFDAIAYEEASFGSHNPARQAAHNRRAGVVELTASQLRVPTLAVNPKTLKKFATNSGNATKANMIAAARSQLQLDTLSDDVADAAWVLAFASHHWKAGPLCTSWRVVNSTIPPDTIPF